MRSLSRPRASGGFLLGFAILWLGASSAEAQQTYYPPSGSTGTWSGYAPGSSWTGYYAGGAWVPYVPGTAAPGTVQPPGNVAPSVTGGYPAPPPGYVYVTQPTTTTTRRALNNGVRYPVRGPTPYADGKPRAYYEYGTGRSVPLAKPWLPGAPGGR